MAIISSLLFSWQASICVMLCFVILCWIAKCLYNLYCHPLRRFPGPVLAAIGSEYEFYHDVIKDGRYMWKIEEMHKRYGPIVRVNANELHICDPHYYNQIYAANGRRVDKWPSMTASYTVPGSSVATVEHDLHRARRGILNPYFSKAAVVWLEPIIKERLERLCAHLTGSLHRGDIVNLDAAFSALTSDVITQYFFGAHENNLGQAGFETPLKSAIVGLTGAFQLTRFFPNLMATMKRLPLGIIALINPSFARLLSWQATLKRNIEDAQTYGLGSKSKSVVLSALADPGVPVEQKGTARLVDEGMVFLIAGSETTARTISRAIFHLLQDRNLLRTLREELETLHPDTKYGWSSTELENLPFLSAVVNEALRLSHGILIRLPRVAIQETLQYGDIHIPAGTPVSTIPYFVHLDPSIFPNPLSFEPDRWFRAVEQGVNLSKFLLSFSKGSRQCLGINLAYAEMYMTIARMVAQFDMHLFDTTAKDLELHHVRIVGYPEQGLGEVKVRVTERR